MNQTLRFGAEARESWDRWDSRVLTGPWQVEGRSKTSFDEMVRLDIRYAQNWSL
jgi:lipopolysaccharide/colanic/teichoic acid biosynthesis glycosyltransferase